MSDSPLVTCIMPTRDRPEFFKRALELFLAQDYPNKQLVVIEDGIDNERAYRESGALFGCLSEGTCTYDGCGGVALVGGAADYYSLGVEHRTIGEKRNVACEFAAAGASPSATDRDLIAHWDDDDWYAPNRLSVQVAAMRAASARLCGLDRSVWYDGTRAWLFRTARRPWLAGGTLMYEKSLWRELGGFQRVSNGEDTAFVDAAHKLGARAAILSDPSIYVGLIHAGNTTPKPVDRWAPFDATIVRRWMDGAAVRA